MSSTRKDHSILNIIRSFLFIADSRFLCIWCGKIGHKPTRCRRGGHSAPTAETLNQLAAIKVDTALCARCELIWPQIIALFAGDNPPPRRPLPSDDWIRKTYSFGPIVHLVLHTHCPLCRLIFVLSPITRGANKKDWQMRLIQAWTPERLGLHAEYVDDIQSYSTCVVGTLSGIDWHNKEASLGLEGGLESP